LLVDVGPLKKLSQLFSAFISWEFFLFFLGLMSTSKRKPGSKSTDLPPPNSPANGSELQKRKKRGKQPPAPNKPKGHKDKTPSPSDDRDFPSPVYNEDEEAEKIFTPDYEPFDDEEEDNLEQKPPAPTDTIPPGNTTSAEETLKRLHAKAKETRLALQVQATLLHQQIVDLRLKVCDASSEELPDLEKQISDLKKRQILLGGNPPDENKTARRELKATPAPSRRR
jgi:hypothetical protein